MTDLHTFTTMITRSIEAAKSSASTPELAQPEFFKTLLHTYFEMIPDDWASAAKCCSAPVGLSLTDVAAALNQDIRKSNARGLGTERTNASSTVGGHLYERASSADLERCMIYQLLLRLTIVIYGIEISMLRPTLRHGVLG